MEPGTELTVPQRVAVALNSEALIKEFTELAEESASITAITNDDSYQQCHAARMRLVKARTTTVKRGKDVREDAQAFAKGVIVGVDQLLAIIGAEEKRLQEIQDAHDAIEEARKREAAEAEAKRIALAQACIAEINGKPMAMTGKPSAAIAVTLHDLRAMDVTPWAAEFLPIALDAQAKAVATLEQLHAGAVAQEQAAAAEATRIADERAELAKLRAEQQERDRQEQARIADQVRRQAEADAVARAKIEAEQRASRELIEQQERSARLAREEQDRKASEDRQQFDMLMQELQGIRQQVIIAQIGRQGVRIGGTISCIEETLAETEGWRIDPDHFLALTGAAQKTKDDAVAAIRDILAQAKARDQEDAARRAEDARRAEELRQEEANLAQQRAEVAKAQEAERARVAAQQARLDGLKRAEEARQQELLDTDHLIAALYERIKNEKKYAAIAKACAAYIEKAQRQAA
jgi:hypothetical protein